jgi:hypothetical protein
MAENANPSSGWATTARTRRSFPDRLDMVHAITAGRAWQRLHLAATVRGLAAQPLNQPVEMIDRNQELGRRDVRAAIGTKWTKAPLGDPSRHDRYWLSWRLLRAPAAACVV